MHYHPGSTTVIDVAMTPSCKREPIDVAEQVPAPAAPSAANTNTCDRRCCFFFSIRLRLPEIIIIQTKMMTIIMIIIMSTMSKQKQVSCT